MNSIGLIINARSDRNTGLIDDLTHVARGFDNVRTEVLDGVIGLGRALADMNSKHVDTLILAGGDGTIQAAFTDSINQRRFERQPYMVALPCGMTNVIANDCGLRGAPTRSLDNFLWRRGRGEVEISRRPLMSVSVGAREPVHGFFLGAGAFHSAVQFSRSTVQAKGVRRSVALFLSVAGYIYKVAFDPEAADDSLMLAFDDLGDDLGGGRAMAPAPQTIFMSTTLNRLGSGIFPFWGKGGGGMVSTMLSYPARRLLRAAPMVLRSKSLPWFEDYGYRSWRADRMKMRFDGPFVFDGEIYHCTAEEGLVIDTRQRVRFMH